MFEFVEGQTYNVRDLLKVPFEVIFQAKEAKCIYLSFDDGVIESTSRECVHAHLLWEMYSIFPYIKVSKAHHIHAYRRRITPGVDGQILNKIKWDCTFECHKEGIYPSLEESCKKIYDITDKADAFYHRLRDYAVYVSSNDFIELQHQPELMDAMTKLREKNHVTDTDISGVYKVLKNVIETKKEIRRNTFVMTTKSESTKIGQLNKIAGPYGFVADVDSNIFKYPILDSLTTGITNIRDLIMESRTAAMSIFYQKHAMQQSEYLTRMLQLAAECVYRVHHTNCGTKRYLEVLIETTDDLKDFEGIWHLCPEEGIEKPITTKSFNLLKRVVRVRSVLFCELPDRYGVCAHCYGQMVHSLFPTDNVGQLAATVIQQKVTQMILSNKHLVSSASSDNIQLSANDQEYLYMNRGDDSRIFVNKNLKGANLRIRFPATEHLRLHDINYVDDISVLSPQRITKLDTLTFDILKGDTLVSSYPVSVSSKSQNAYFSKEVLAYMKKHGWDVDAAGNYELTLGNWDFDQPFLNLPKVQYSTPAHMKAIKEMLTTSDRTKDNKYSLSKAPNPAAALVAFHDLVKLRLNVNFSHLQTIILTYLCADPANFDYRIPIKKADGKLMPYKDIMVTRDMALAMAYENHYDTLKSMRSYVIEQRHPHPHNNALRG